MSRLPPIPLETDQIHLRLLATTDVHVQIHPYDYYADRPAPGTGLAHAATVIARLRAEVPNCLLFDNGDVLQGNPMGDYIAEVRGLPPDAAHPAIAAMNALGYDAATLGNHEFNYGLEFLSRALSGARFPVTCANVVTRLAADPADDETLLPPFLLLDRDCQDASGGRHTLRIGVIGVLPQQIVVWDRSHLDGRVAARDILSCAATRSVQMRDAGADLIVALCHSGIGPAEALPGMENAATALAGLPEIDAVITGHSHLVFPGADFAGQPGVDPVAGMLSGKPAVMAGCFGSHLGLIDLALQKTPTGRWRVTRSRSEAIPLSRHLPNDADPHAAALMTATRADHDATLAHIRRRIGRTEAPLTTFFAALPGNAALDLIARAQAWHVAQALADTPYADYPLLSAASPFKMGGRGGPGWYTDVPAGDLALRHVADLYPYPNTICAVLVTGAELHGWLERAAEIFQTIVPGVPDQPLIAPEVPSSHFDVIRGVTWTIDLSHPTARAAQHAAIGARTGRIRELRHAGQPISPGDRFVIATNSYRAAGGGGFPGADGTSIIYQGHVPNRDILWRFIETSRPNTAPAPRTWQFCSLPGTSAIYLSSPRATEHLSTVAAMQIEHAGEDSGGFARFRIHL